MYVTLIKEEVISLRERWGTVEIGLRGGNDVKKTLT